MPDSTRGNAIGIFWKFTICTISLAILFLFVAYGMEEKGLVAAFSFGIIAVVARARWDLRNAWPFRMYMGLCIALHLYLIISFDWKIDVKPTILLAPIVIADFIAMLGGVFW